jgi:hypothetical protein
MGESVMFNEVTARVHTMIKANEIEGLGVHEFRIMPRVGEHIIRNVEEIGQAYQVATVHHPDEPTMTMGDIYIVYVGNLLDHLESLIVASQNA